MLQLIIGEKGKGKTKVLLEKANQEIKNANGNIVYLDKSSQHMYELNNKVRLIDVTTFPVRGFDAFVGFICGIISQDHDLEQMYLDSFLTLAGLEGQEDNIEGALDKLEMISRKYDVNFVISISVTAPQVPDKMKDCIIAEL